MGWRSDGEVRVGCSTRANPSGIAPNLEGLYRRFPQLHVELRVDDRLADLARDDIDIAVRTGELVSDALVARPIGAFSRMVVASPAYLERFGTPRTVGELDGHRLIGHTVNPEVNRWPLRSAGNDAAYQVHAAAEVEFLKQPGSSF